MSGPQPDSVPAAVRELAARRAAARSAGDYGAADALRAEMAGHGWTITDGPAGEELFPLAATPAAGAAGAAASGAGRYQVRPDPGALPAAAAGSDDRLATVALLAEGWPEDLQACLAALLSYAPAGVMISVLDVANRDGAGDVLHQTASAHPGRIEDWHVAASPGWSASRNALLRADPGPIHVLMETSTILTGDAITPLLAAVAAAGVVAAGWRGADPDPDLRGFHAAGPGEVTALLGYLLAVRTGSASAAGGLPPKARFYRNADLEFSLRLGRLGRLVVPPEPLPARQTRHRGFHDSDPEYRDRESVRNYRRVLELLRSRSAAPADQD